MATLCDVSILLALVTDQHPHHGAAVRWVDTTSIGEARICRLAQLGLLRLLNNPAVMRDDVLDTDGCWMVWSQLLGDERFQFTWTEPAGLDAIFARFTAAKSFTPRLWTDAYLAAYACASQHTLVTFDHGFANFPGLNYEIL